MLAIHVAARDGNFQAVKDQLDKGMHVDVLTQNSASVSALYYAAKGHLPVVKLLVERKAAVDSRGDENRTALHRACAWDYTATAEFLLDCKANINATDNDGWTALMLPRGVTVVQLLLDRQADAFAQDIRGQTALDIAFDIDMGDEAIAEALQKHCKFKLSTDSV